MILAGRVSWPQCSRLKIPITPAIAAVPSLQGRRPPGSRVDERQQPSTQGGPVLRFALDRLLGLPSPFSELQPRLPERLQALVAWCHPHLRSACCFFNALHGIREDVPAWLKSLRLHKYAALFSQMTYEEMMALTECQLEAQNVTKGARHKIVISIQKLKERQNLLKSLERDILEGGNLRVPLQELHQMILTPIKAYSSQNSSTEEHSRDADSHHPSSLLGSDGQGSDCKDSAAGGMQQHHLPGCEGESGGAPLPEGDLPGQFTRVMGKVCTQLLVSRPDEENISSYLQLIDKCLIHEAFTEIQKKRLLSWKQQVQKLFRSFPRKSLLELSGYRQQRSRGFGQSNSLPTAGSAGAGLGRRNPRQFQIPSRNLPTARLGLLGPSGLLGTPQRSPAASPAILKQGRQNLWFANPGGSNSMPSRSHSSVQRTRSLPVHTSPQTMLMFQQPEFQVPVTEPDINNRLESLCLSMTEHALSGEHSLLLGLFQHVHAASAEPPGPCPCPTPPKSWDRLWL
ncbi:hypothetical protein QYF61_004329 [Mycteria americana]|uniref:Protein Smaug homolog 1 n=1 Tax=Mycteria americana TaxID=33587 RepID=A0AAN7RYN6_MYCAM|nr:hypothetical protein QYF61_004329 [Mycteria americana]